MFFNYYWWDIVAKKANILKGYIGKNLESRLREGITVDLEQCGFELCGSTYMQIFQWTHAVQTHVVQGSANSWESSHAEVSLKLQQIFDCTGSGVPHPLVQGSMLVISLLAPHLEWT